MGTRLLAFALLLTACSKTSTPPAPKDEPAKGGCDALFVAPAGAEKLCEEHVNATDSEVAWSSYALADPVLKVTQRYRDIASTCAEAKPTNDSIAVGDRHVSIHDATAAGYPSCEKKPSATQKTVVVVSRRTLRAP